MKKIMIALSLMITLTANAFSGEEQIDRLVLDKFKIEFATAKDVSWQANDNFYQASFEYQGERVFAFYNYKAELMAVTRYILSTELPEYLQKKVKKNYADYWVADLFEVKTDDGTSYYITLQNADEKIFLESKNQHVWEPFRRY